MPSAESERARDGGSIYLHLLVNRLGIGVISQLIGRARTLRLFERPYVYPWSYATVIEDWVAIGAVLKETGFAPMPDARRVLSAMPD